MLVVFEVLVFEFELVLDELLADLAYRYTVVPASADVPLDGDWLYTTSPHSPSAKITLKPLAVSVLLASLAVVPYTLGTETLSVPLLT